MRDVVVVTGAGRGIGAEIVKQYANSVHVISIERPNNERPLGVQKLERGYRVVGEISDPETWSAVMALTKENNFAVKKLYFNAGVNVADDSSVDSIVSTIEDNLSVNFHSVLNAMHTLGPHFSEKYIYISSMSTIFPGSENIGYSLSKVCSEVLFAALGRRKIGAFQVFILGPIKTDFTKDLIQSAGALKKLVFNFIAMEKAECAQMILRKSNTPRPVIYLPVSSLVIYRALQVLRIFSTKVKLYGFPS